MKTDSRTLFLAAVLSLALSLAVLLAAPMAFAQESTTRQALTTEQAQTGKTAQKATLTSIKDGWWAIDAVGNKIDSSYKVEWTGSFLNPIDAITNGKTTIKRPEYSPYLSSNRDVGTATVTIRGNQMRGYQDSFTLSFRIVPKGTLNTYGIVKSDGYLHRTNAAHTIDYGKSWGTTSSQVRSAIDEITTLYIDADVTSLEKVNIVNENGRNSEVIFMGNRLNLGPDNLQKIEFLLKNGTNQCSRLDSWYMFGMQSNLTEVVNFDKTNLSTLSSGCFYKCSSLASIKLPSTLSAIGDSVFYDCDALKVLDVPASVKSIATSSWTDGALAHCDNLQKIILRSPSLVTVVRNELRDTNKNVKIYVPNSIYPKYQEKVNSNGWYAYGDYTSQIHPFLEASNIADQKYTGKAIKPAVSVTWIGSKLAASNYSVAYKNNVKVGTATATVTGKNGYTGTASKTFKITAQSASKPSSSNTTSPTTQKTVPVYWLVHKTKGENLYTTDANEVKQLSKGNWANKGIVWYAPTTGAKVYRLYAKKINDHHYTSDLNEVRQLTKGGTWKIDSGKPMWYSGGKARTYRMFNPARNTSRLPGTHRFATSQAQVNTLKSQGWVQDGVKMYGVKVK